MIDVGSCLCKAGYGGDDIPKAIFPSVSLPCDERIASHPLIVDPRCCRQSVGCLHGGADASGMEVESAPTSKRQLFVGQHAVNFKRDHMEVRERK